MSTVRDIVTVTVSGTVQPRPRRGRTARPGNQPRTTVRVDQRVLTAALDLAGGDPSRLVIDPDGSVLVQNRSRVDRCPVCGSTVEHHVAYVRESGRCVV